MDTQSESQPIYECRHCGTTFHSQKSLTSHIGRQKRCNEKEKIMKLHGSKKLKTQREEKETQGNPDFVQNRQEVVNESTETEIVENDFQVNIMQPSLNDDYSDLRISTAFKNCNNGQGLSISDMTRILDALFDPNFKLEKVSFNNGKACNLWLKKKMEEQNGPLQVIFLY